MNQDSDLAVENEPLFPGTMFEETKQDQSPLRRGVGLTGKVLVGVVVLASFGVWVYAYSGAAVRDAPDRFDETELARQSEQICQGALNEINALPGALEAKDEVERAAQLRTSNVILETMVDDIAQLEPSTDRDDAIMGLWLDDWRVLLTDRAAHAERVASDPDAKFFVTNTGVGERLDKRITRLANTNSMPTCIAPQDVG